MNCPLSENNHNCIFDTKQEWIIKFKSPIVLIVTFCTFLLNVEVSPLTEALSFMKEWKLEATDMEIIHIQIKNNFGTVLH